MTRNFLLALSLMTILLLASCQKQEEAPKPATAPPVTDKAASAPEAKADAGQPPPAPPIREDFEGKPKLSLFPRIGDFCPEEGNKEGQAYWLTFIDHLVRTSGPIKGKNGTGFSIRGIKSVDSVGFFSPLAVTPDTNYRVSFRFWGKLPKGGLGGAGILEFNEFLWIPGQYPKSLSEKHFQRAQPGVQLTGSHAGEMQSFTFRTGPSTRMIHLVFFREGTPDREAIVIDDIEINHE